VPFAGWEMPVSYPIGTVAEVKACRTGIGLFDVSHMGEVLVWGPDAERFLNFATPGFFDSSSPGHAQYSLLLNDNGTIIDDIIVYPYSPEHILIVVNASRIEEDSARFLELAQGFDIDIEDRSPQKSLIAVQGPKSLDAARQLVRIPTKRFEFCDCEIDGNTVMVARTGYTGEDGVEILCDNEAAPGLWKKLVQLGGVQCGLGARDVLRLEAGYPLYGHELDEAHTPYESGVGWVIKPGNEGFVGRKALIEAHANKPGCRLVGLKAVSPANSIPRQGCIVESLDSGKIIGDVTSGTLSPTLGCGIALARVEREFAKTGTTLTIDIRGRKVPAEVVRTPFVKTSLDGEGE
jgi:aminomethyltransferase